MRAGPALRHGPIASATLSRLTPRAQEIVRVARELLDREGPEALSMRRIGSLVGIRAASLYEHLRDKQTLEAALISLGFEEQADLFDNAVAASDDPLAALATAYRQFAHKQPHLYRLMTERPLPRDRLTPGVEAAAAKALLDATHGDLDQARAFWAFAHGMVILELNQRFPPTANLDPTWQKGLTAFRDTQ
ncbi:TetR/AcrR family transcriptional regulator [Kribbella sp. NPDC006257]|uniref:TetR/AcrR family transcriptional regulator n=1 Tax=Kribbella sp. NPDC006257 TaxID=3156738 RepID=UPI0033B3D359